MANNNSIAIANETLDNMFDAIREMDVMNDDTSKKLEEMINKVKSFKDSLDKKAKNKNDRPISLKESQSTDTIEEEYNDPYEEPDDEEDDDDECDGSSTRCVLDNVTRILMDDYIDKNNGLPKPGLQHYAICIRDLKNNVKVPIARNLISLIKDNSAICGNKHYKSLAENNMRLIDGNPLTLSGLFIYKVTSDNPHDSLIWNNDVIINVYIPASKVTTLIDDKGIPVDHVIGIFEESASHLKGHLLSFDDMKNIITSPDVIVTKGISFNLDARYDWGHSLLKTDKSELIIFDDYNAYYDGRDYNDILATAVTA